MDSDQHESVVLFITGEDSNRSLYFGICIGLNLETGEKILTTVCGTPEQNFLSRIDLDDPEKTRDVFIKAKQKMQETDRVFYIDHVETNFDDFWDEYGKEVLSILRNQNREPAQTELQELIDKNLTGRQIDSLRVSISDIEELNLQSEDPENEAIEEKDSDSTGMPEESDEDENSSTESLYKVEPVLDVNDGKNVQNLLEGDEISIKLTGDTATEVKNRVSDNPDAELPPLSAKVLFVEEQGESQNVKVLTELQDGLYGILKAPRGSKVETEFAPVSTAQQNYETQISSMVLILLSSLLLMVLVTFIIIF